MKIAAAEVTRLKLHSNQGLSKTDQSLVTSDATTFHADSCTLRVVVFALAGMLLSGCLPKPATVSTRHFVLAPMTTNASTPTAAGERLAIGLGFVKMPSYVLRDSIALRKGPIEIEYLDDARWGERLDLGFRRTVAADLEGLLPSDTIYLTDWARQQVTTIVSITVGQFDVDTSGRGTLRAQWRITSSASGVPPREGNARLERTGAAPGGNPQAIAKTLSELTAEFSRELAHAIRATASTKPQAQAN